MSKIYLILGQLWVVGPLFKHRNLLIRFTQRYIERQTKGSWLGLFWLILDPLLRLALYTVVFGMIMGGSFGMIEDPGPWDYPIGIFIGLTVLGLINETLGESSNLILGNPNLVQKVVFPLEILPVALVGSIGFRTLVSIALAFGGILLAGPGLSLYALWFPLIILPLLIMSLGIAYFISAMGVYFRDSQQFMGFLTQAIFYASAVFYPVAKIPEPIYQYLKYNPIMQAISLSRDVLLWQISVDFQILGYLYGLGFGCYFLGYYIFKSLRSGFADVL